MDSDFTEHSIAELVRVFPKAKNIEEQKDLCNQIFGQCYKRFDEQIRAYLRSEGIPYEVDEEYYNTVFFGIYSRIFSLNNFQKKLAQFDLNKRFYPWFCSVVRGEIRDWLRRVNPETKLSNKEKLKTIAKNRAKEKSLEEARVEYPGSGTLDVASTDCRSAVPCEEEFHEQVRNLINTLPPFQRIVIGLEFIAYQDIGPEEITYIARKTRRTNNQVRKEISELQKALVASPQFKENELKRYLVTSLSLREDAMTRKISFLKNNLLACGNLKEMEKEADKITLKEIRKRVQLKKALIHEESHRGEKLEAKSHELDLAKLYYMEAFKRLRKTRKERQVIIREYRNGGYKLYSRPSTDQMASILGVKTGTIGSTKSKAKKALWRAFAKLQEKDRIEKPDEEKEKKKVKIHRKR